MKNKIFATNFIILLAFTSGAQDVVDPYYNYSNSHPIYSPTGGMPHYQIPNPYPPNFRYDFFTDLSATHGNTNYNGVYMIQFNLLWWFNDYLNGGTFHASNFKTYKVEVVGYPFVMNCAYTNGCTDGSTTTRNLEMPNYTLSNEQWGTNVWRKRNDLTTNPFNALGEASDLISINFNSNAPIPATGQPYYPHSIHKFTVYLHCGPYINDEIGDSLVFMYDLTRGRMRDYPFTTQNTQGVGGSTYWDVVFRPRLVYKDFGNGHSYGETTNNDIYINGKTLNYFPFRNGNNCEPVLNSDYLYDATQSAFLYTPPVPYCLTSFLIYTQYGYFQLAGYQPDPFNNSLLAIRPGIKHTYSIQNNIDLTEINPDEKTIYNPSEVNITANNLIFPTGYTFKTIRGVYPTESQVNADNTSANGGSYNDLRDVPVTTDLFSENTADPANEHVYASRYYLQSGSQLTVQNCVRIFDATIDVHQGATLIFNDHSNIVGREDKSYQNGRYKIQGLGGAVLRNNDPVQYVTNGSITQAQPLEYTATNKIISGKTYNSLNVDPNTDQLPGDYTLEANANVAFRATNEIRLTDGFRAKEGSTFRAYCSQVDYILPCEYDQLRGGRFAYTLPTHHTPQPTLLLSPNPTTGKFNLYNTAHKLSACILTVSDVMGNIIYSAKSESTSALTVDLSAKPKGIYFVKLEESEKVTVNKIILQ